MDRARDFVWLRFFTTSNFMLHKKFMIFSLPSIDIFGFPKTTFLVFTLF